MNSAPKIIVVLILAVALAGCTTSRHFSRTSPAETLDEVNHVLEDHLATIEFIDGTTTRADRGVKIHPEVIIWKPIRSSRSREAATATIRRITVKPSRSRAWAPLVGLGAGLTAGMLIATLMTSGCEGDGCLGQAFAALGVIVGGSAVGFVTGVTAMLQEEKPELIVVYEGPVEAYFGKATRRSTP